MYKSERKPFIDKVIRGDTFKLNCKQTLANDSQTTFGLVDASASAHHHCETPELDVILLATSIVVTNQSQVYNGFNLANIQILIFASFLFVTDVPETKL
jgi:hypothetical protein